LKKDISSFVKLGFATLASRIVKSSIVVERTLSIFFVPSIVEERILLFVFVPSIV
jgi:hypothetical protein